MISKEQLSGTWELESWTIGYADRDDFSYPYGEDPQGLLLYTGDGWMSASICRAGRAPLPADVSFRTCRKRSGQRPFPPTSTMPVATRCATAM